MRRFAILSIAVLAAAVFTAAACTTKGENSALVTANATPPASGVVEAGAIGTVGVVLFPSRFSAASAGVAAGSFIRATLHVEGKLLDGSSVKTSEREFLFQTCGTTGCAGNPCL